MRNAGSTNWACSAHPLCLSFNTPLQFREPVCSQEMCPLTVSPANGPNKFFSRVSHSLGESAYSELKNYF